MCAVFGKSLLLEEEKTPRHLPLGRRRLGSGITASRARVGIEGLGWGHARNMRGTLNSKGPQGVL